MDINDITKALKNVYSNIQINHNLYVNPTSWNMIQTLLLPSYERIDHKICRTRLEQIKRNKHLELYYNRSAE